MSKLILYSSPPLPCCAQHQMARFKPLNSHQVVEYFNTTLPLLAVYPYVCMTVRNTGMFWPLKASREAAGWAGQAGQMTCAANTLDPTKGWFDRA
jgi:hypothetical protein